MGKLMDRYNEAIKAKTLRTVTPKYIEFKKAGECVVGILKGISSVGSSRDESSYNQYLVDTDMGMSKFAMGSATDKEVQPLLVIGVLYAFTFKGKEKLDAKRSVNKFLIEEVGYVEMPITGNPDDVPFDEEGGTSASKINEK